MLRKWLKYVPESLWWGVWRPRRHQRWRPQEGFSHNSWNTMCSQVRLRAALIEELTKMFTVCYEKPPTANQLDVLNQMQSSNVPSSFLEENIAFNYQKRLNDLIAGLLIPSGPISIHIPGHHQTKCDSSLLVLDLARTGKGSWQVGTADYGYEVSVAIQQQWFT